MIPYKERDPTQRTKNSHTARMGKPCEICGKKREYHTREEALRCLNALSNDPNPSRRDF